MDNKQFTTRLAKRASMDYRETAAMIQSVNSAIINILCEGDSIAIPGFGTFSTINEEEKISRDLSTGKQILLPPNISMTFNASGMLKKNL